MPAVETPSAKLDGVKDNSPQTQGYQISNWASFFLIYGAEIFGGSTSSPGSMTWAYSLDIDYDKETLFGLTWSQDVVQRHHRRSIGQNDVRPHHDNFISTSTKRISRLPSCHELTEEDRVFANLWMMCPPSIYGLTNHAMSLRYWLSQVQDRSGNNKRKPAFLESVYWVTASAARLWPHFFYQTGRINQKSEPASRHCTQLAIKGNGSDWLDKVPMILCWKAWDMTQAREEEEYIWMFPSLLTDLLINLSPDRWCDQRQRSLDEAISSLQACLSLWNRSKSYIVFRRKRLRMYQLAYWQQSLPNIE